MLVMLKESLLSAPGSCDIRFYGKAWNHLVLKGHNITVQVSLELTELYYLSLDIKWASKCPDTHHYTAGSNFARNFSK